MGANNLAGAWGEALAAQYLRRHRYAILAQGYRCKFGEIDLVARDRGTIVFVEVKLRKNDSFASAAEYVGFRKQQRLRSTAAMYLSEYQTGLPARFDVIEIYAPEGTATRRPEIHHIKEAFR